MLTNKHIISNNEHVKFVDYTGKWPTLCNGILTLLVNGKEYKFGDDYTKFESWKTDGNYDKFWSSGGKCGFYGALKGSYTYEGEWVIDVDKLPEEIRQYATEIDEVFNENVKYGCCGGCL